MQNAKSLMQNSTTTNADEGISDPVAMAPIHHTDGQVVGVVEVMDDAAWQELSAREQSLQTALLLALAAIFSALLAALFARHLGGPLQRLTDAARAVSASRVACSAARWAASAASADTASRLCFWRFLA